MRKIRLFRQSSARKRSRRTKSSRNSAARESLHNEPGNAMSPDRINAKSQRIRWNHSIDSMAESRANNAAAAVKSEVISVSFFSITRREFRVL